MVRIPVGPVTLEGDLTLPAGAHGIVVFAHGSGSSRRSPRNRYVAHLLNDANLATLLFDLLTPAEEVLDRQTGELRFDIHRWPPRVRAATLLIVGGEDEPVIRLNQAAFERLRCEKQLVIIPGATHLFEEPGALDEVARLAREWFERYLVLAEAR